MAMDKIYGRFSPLSIEKGEGRFSVNVYGRRYTFENSFPSV